MLRGGCLGSGPRRIARDARQGSDPRHRRQRPSLLDQHERRYQYRRWHGLGLSGRAASGRHGVRAVSPNHIEGHRDLDYGRRQRRRRLSPEHAWRALHETVRAGANGAGDPLHVSPRPSVKKFKKVEGSMAVSCWIFGISAAAASSNDSHRSENCRWSLLDSIRSKPPFPYDPAPTTKWAA